MDKNAASTIIHQFCDEHQHIEKEALRIYVFDQLTDIHRQLGYILSYPDNDIHWKQLQDLVTSSGNELQLRTIADLRTFDEQIHSWIEEHVDTPERLEFSIELKATEIASGDREFDYFAAQLIRHDQLLAAVFVYQLAVKKFEDLLQISIDVVLDDPVFAFFCEMPLDSRIFSLAEQVYQLRMEEK